MANRRAPFVPRETLLDVEEAQSASRHLLRDLAILMTANYLGLRSCELAALSLRDVIDGNGELVDTLRLLAAYTKGGKYREVPLAHPRPRGALRAYLATRNLTDLDRPLFMTERGSQFSADTMRQNQKRIYRRAKIDATGHSGRRAFATEFYEATQDPRMLMAVMGHSHFSSTIPYIEENPKRMRRAMAAIP